MTRRAIGFIVCGERLYADLVDFCRLTGVEAILP
jgi:hypothetical protein